MGAVQDGDFALPGGKLAVEEGTGAGLHGQDRDHVSRRAASAPSKKELLPGCVVKDRDLVIATGHALAEQLVVHHGIDRRRVRVVEPGTDHIVDHIAVAEAMGCRAIRVRQPEDCASALAEAKRLAAEHRVPVVVEFLSVMPHL